jgi:hypothetical protein
MIGKPVPDFALAPLDGLKAESGAPVHSFTPPGACPACKSIRC